MPRRWANSRRPAAKCHDAPICSRLSAFEGAQLRGEVLPLDAAANGAGKLGLAIRVPCWRGRGDLAVQLSHAHGAAQTGAGPGRRQRGDPQARRRDPLAALKLTELLIEAGLPPLALQCLTGDGATLGRRLCADQRVRKITLTGWSRMAWCSSASPLPEARQSLAQLRAIGAATTQ